MIRAALGVLLLVCPVAVHAQSPAPPSRLEDVAPSARERHAARARELERSLERLLASVPGVVRATAVAQLPDPALVPLDQALPAPRVVVSVRIAGSSPSESHLRELSGKLLAVHPQSQLQLVVSREPALTITKQSAPSEALLRNLLALSLAANVLLATILLANLKRKPASVTHSARRR